MGIPRVLEALEANDWAAVDGGGEDDDSDFGAFEEELGLAAKADSEADGTTTSTAKTRNKQQDDGDGDGDFDPESMAFGYDPADFEGLRKAIWAGSNGGEDGDG